MSRCQQVIHYFLLSLTLCGAINENIPPTSSCSFNNIPFECIAAQYPKKFSPLPSIIGAKVQRHLEENNLGNLCDGDGLLTNEKEHTALFVKRGGCSFSDKTLIAASRGYQILVIVNSPETETLVPSLEVLSDESIGIPSVVLISDETYQTHFTSSEWTTSSLSLKWSNWVPDDATSMYYEGIRLKKAGQYAEAAQMHLKSTQRLNFEFKSAGYEYVNNLLRAGASNSDLVRAVKETKVLPLNTPEDWDNLETGFSKMTHQAHRRIFREQWSPIRSLQRSGNFLSSMYHVPTRGFKDLLRRLLTELSPKRDIDTDVFVVCVATDETPELEALRTSVRNNGYELVVLGLGAEYGSSGGTKLALMEDWLLSPDGLDSLNTSDDTLLLFVDAYDVLLLPPSRGLVEVFDRFNASMVISGETGCWPDPGVAPAYPWALFDQQPHFGDLYEKEERKLKDDDVHVPFPYPNSGGYVARVSYMRSMIQEVMRDVRLGHVGGGGTMGDADDQRWLQRQWLRHPQEVAIDVFAEIFLSLHRLELPIALGSSSTSLKHPLHISEEGTPLTSEIAKHATDDTLWMKIGDRAVSPLVVHGNGHGKRMFRVLSCRLGLHCKWEQQHITVVDEF